jgi:hypothetical protein
MYNLNDLVQHVLEVNMSGGAAIPIKLKFLYLFRETFAMVKARDTVEMTTVGNSNFAAHAKVLAGYQKTLVQLYELTAARVPNLWSSVNGECFLVQEQCPALVRSLLTFLEWTQEEAPTR